jgi:hypothetical protein
MAKLLSITATGTAADAVAAQTGVATDETPFARGMNALVLVDCKGVTGTPTIKVQTSADNSTWADAASVTTITSNVYLLEVTLSNYIRTNVTVAGSAGDFSAVLIG